MSKSKSRAAAVVAEVIHDRTRRLKEQRDQARRIAVELEQRNGEALRMLALDEYPCPDDQDCPSHVCAAVRVLRGED